MNKRITTQSPEGWSWLGDTYWYVQERWLPALRYDSPENKLNWMVDQTVWHITGYRYGYFSGVAGVLVYPAGEGTADQGPRSRPVPMTLIGTVTPGGTVGLTFLPQSGSGQITSAPGRIVEMSNQRTFEMQMASGSGDPLTAHWAYMFQTHEGDLSWEHLPGTDLSVPKFLEGIEPPGWT
ncbi:MAG: hypothetical protein GY940_17440 [bacterium]|nr:hypothetical protein [bacterium]